MADPFKQLATVLEMRMAGHAAAVVSGIPCELGTITASGLKLDNFKHEIQDYLIADWLVKLHLPAFSLTGTVTGLQDSSGGTITGTGTFSFQAAEIADVRLNLKAGLKPGDRVLAGPVNGGKDAIVLCKVVSG